MNNSDLPKLKLRKPTENDSVAIKACYERSASLHHPWTYASKNIKEYLTEENRYFLYLDTTTEIVGTFNITGIVRGYFQSAYLGYEVFTPHQGKGYMTQGIQLIIDLAFKQMNLHRLEANIQPHNDSSIKLVSRAGFTKEGFSKNYLNIGGQGWKDHERWALVNDNWKA